MSEAKKYCMENCSWLKTNLTKNEFTQLAILSLQARDFEFGVASTTVERDANKLGIKMFWRD